MNIRCIKCKGRGFCKRPVCAIATKIMSQKRVNLQAKQDFFGEAPNVFIGRYGYPDINVGILSTDHYDDHDAPLLWSANDFKIPDVIDKRTALINSGFKTNIRSFKDRMLEISQEVSLAHKPVDIEINLDKKPSFALNFNQDTMPHGPRVKLKKVRLTENPKIPHNVDKLVSETDVKASDAISVLRKNYDEHYLTKILSVGNLGVKKERKLVPTRWSITAVDDIIGKQLTDDVKKFKESENVAFFGGYLGNYYLILLMPNCWSYELFETVVGEHSSFATDYENYDGRKNYAHNTAGGYYAARHAILEKLSNTKRQAGVLALRFITNEYWAPLGVWVVREATRKSLLSKPIEFSSRELMMKYACAFVRKKFGFDLDILLKQSKLIDQQNTQKRLVDYQ
ncbi:hypothetical protein HQ545_06075 [Candidatus Woesearchaeota archaeon]|nr:hypothetical protein [Candidatus Woesearchaeota archaeon]